MTQRDPLMSADYWEEWTEFQEESIEEYETTAAAASTQADHRRRLRYAIFKEHFHLLISRYSQGAPIEDLQQALPQVVATLETYQQEVGSDGFHFNVRESYIVALWLLSLGVLFDADQELIERILQLIGNEGKDAIFERLAALRLAGRKSTTEVLHAKPYEALYEALETEGKARDALIKKFLKQYYPSMRGCYWYDLHLKAEDLGFFGYWCFELAAFVKELHIPDASFADDPYYPRDLARA